MQHEKSESVVKEEFFIIHNDSRYRKDFVSMHSVIKKKSDKCWHTKEIWEEVEKFLTKEEKYFHKRDFLFLFFGRKNI